MNGRASKAALRQELLAIVEAQKGVIGALARGLTQAQTDIVELKRQRERTATAVPTPEWVPAPE